MIPGWPLMCLKWSEARTISDGGKNRETGAPSSSSTVVRRSPAKLGVGLQKRQVVTYADHAQWGVLDDFAECGRGESDSLVRVHLSSDVLDDPQKLPLTVGTRIKAHPAASMNHFAVRPDHPTIHPHRRTLRVGVESLSCDGLGVVGVVEAGPECVELHVDWFLAGAQELRHFRREMNLLPIQVDQIQPLSATSRARINIACSGSGSPSLRSEPACVLWRASCPKMPISNGT